MAAAGAVAATEAPVLPYRVGHGFDLHRLAEGYKLIIGGVEIPHTKGCEAHSDGAHAQWGPERVWASKRRSPLFGRMASNGHASSAVQGAVL